MRKYALDLHLLLAQVVIAALLDDEVLAHALFVVLQSFWVVVNLHVKPCQVEIGLNVIVVVGKSGFVDLFQLLKGIT